MPGRVVDASALAALAFGEGDAERVRDLLSGAEIYAPTLLPYELTSVARKKSQRAPERSKAMARALAAALELEMRLFEISHAEVLALALETGLTTHDASYLYVSRLLDIPLVTLDARLAGFAGG